MLRKAAEWLCVVAAVALPVLSYPLAWLPPGVASYRYVLHLPVEVLLFCAVLVGLAGRVAGFWGGGGSRPVLVSVPRRLVWPAGLWLASALVAVRFSEHPHFSVLALPVWAANLCVFAVATQFSQDRLRLFCWVWLCTAAVVAVNGLVRIGREPEFLSTLGNRNFLGAYLAASIPVGLALWDWRASLLCAVLVAALCFCGSRGAWLALAVVGLVVVLWRARKRPLVLAGVCVVVAGAVVAGRGVVAELWRTDVRPVIWQGTLRMVAERPVVGHGLGTFVVEYARFRLPEYFLRPKATNLTDHAHNELLEVAAEQGLLGAAALVWLWVAALRAGVRAEGVGPAAVASSRRLRWGLAGAAAVLVLHGMVDVGLRYAPNGTLVWLLLGLLAGQDREGAWAVRAPGRWVGGVVGAVCVVSALWLLKNAVVLPVRADFWERRARLAQEAGRLDLAELAARRSLGAQPLRLRMHDFLASVYAQDASTLGRGIEQCLRLEELAPDYADTPLNLGQLYLRDGRPGEALPHLERAVRMNPYSAQKRYVLALALAQLGRADAAREQLEAALRLEPGHGGARGLLSEIEQRF